LLYGSNSICGNDDDERVRQHQFKQMMVIQYEGLLSDLHGRAVTVERTLDMMLSNSHCIVVCLWRGDCIVATAQASLMFPAGMPTVYISDVVVAPNSRGAGVGSRVLLELEHTAIKRWCPIYKQLRFMLTSRPERGTEGFYCRSGYTQTATMRYEKQHKW
jgi:GNAT superfamily N-acetyltransferase